ncbi:GH36 C-terminal domain-containing protein [Streptomyces werraensis]|uniref:GH36 C-terminal domain-containing protein n=1 Tax=Streptomyces werraensis TaxID=68284 RepID=UPI003419B798
MVLVLRASPRHGAPRVPLRLRGLPSGVRFRDTERGTVHHATVLTEYGLDVDLPSGDWASALIHLERVPDGAGDRADD